ncbi:hypothetical protein Asi03nite_15480 [Actinoplanes siamensis]|uniref:Uncharacterized protein n=1 Tax=Actinoplanes siamensis TaxID=1223317 RepID=A0A919N425_9ACTN|nr:hypothetical protein Asi03nite_15480 [Actinoplanes siamensis]
MSDADLGDTPAGPAGSPRPARRVQPGAGPEIEPGTVIVVNANKTSPVPGRVFHQHEHRRRPLERVIDVYVHIA